jgi:radical SAM protein with 4Fe4S-binding SPASM domain
MRESIVKPIEITVGASPATGASYDLPDFYELEPTRGCNLKCRMCHVSFMTDPVAYMDIDAIKDFSFLKGKTVSIGAVFEPCIHPKINKLIDILNQNECKLVLITNGHNLHKKQIPALFESNVEAITFSFDGITKESYELVRVGGNFERTLDNISSFMNGFHNKDTIFSVNYTVLKCNLEEVPDAVEFWNKRDMDLIRFIASVTREDNEFLKENSMWENRKRYFELLDRSAEYVIDNKTKISVSSPYFESEPARIKFGDHVEKGVVSFDQEHVRLPKLYPRFFQYGADFGMTFPCKSPFVAARMIWDGSVMLCHNHVVGNLYENSFEEAWNSRAADELRQSVVENHKLCDKCDYFRLCINSHYVDLDKKENYFSGAMLERRSVMTNVLSKIKSKIRPYVKRSGTQNKMKRMSAKK